MSSEHEGARVPPSEGTLAWRIYSLRMERGLSQEDLAQLVGVSVDQVRKVEQGRTRNMQNATYRKYADALKTSFEYLKHGAGVAPYDRRQMEWADVDIETFMRSKGMTDQQLLNHIRTQVEILLEEDRRRRRLMEAQEDQSM